MIYSDDDCILKKIPCYTMAGYKLNVLQKAIIMLRSIKYVSEIKLFHLCKKYMQ